ncbi:dihydrolipoyl dehydrogenase [Myxococcota bacterium]
MVDESLDAIVIGGGPGGYVCAIRLGQLGQRVACVEAEEVGGVCLNWGCIPSKVLISAAHLYTQIRQGHERGVRATGLDVELPVLQDHKAGVVKRLTKGIRGLFRGAGVVMVEGRAELVARNTVRVTERTGGVRTLRADKAIVLATGSNTIELPALPWNQGRIISAREAVSLREIPRRLLVVGGGVIGLELGMAYQALGAELTVVELLPSLLPGIEPDCVEVVNRRLLKRGGKVLLRTRAVGCRTAPSGTLKVELESSEGPVAVECDQVLVAVGMRPCSAGLGLEALGVHVDSRGFVPANERCETNVPGLYAIGDLSGPPMLAHKASKEGEVCAEVIAGQRAAKDWRAIPAVVFSDPEIASVGMGEQETAARGLKTKIGRFPFAALGRAMSLGETEGFVKVVSDAETGRVLGVHIVGSGASDLIGEAGLALELGATVQDLALTMHPHPTLTEALMEAGAAALGHSIHILNR